MAKDDDTVHGAHSQYFRAWMAPNFAVPLDLKYKSVPLRDLDNVTLTAMAERWLGDLYSKAGRANPWKHERQARFTDETTSRPLTGGADDGKFTDDTDYGGRRGGAEHG